MILVLVLVVDIEILVYTTSIYTITSSMVYGMILYDGKFMDVAL